MISITEGVQDVLRKAPECAQRHAARILFVPEEWRHRPARVAEKAIHLGRKPKKTDRLAV